MPKSSEPADRILFFYRTAKKKRYFNYLSTEALSDYTVSVHGYSALSRGVAPALDRAACDRLIVAAQDELYHARLSSAAAVVRVCSVPALKFLIKRLYRRIYALMSSEKPDVVGLWNGNKIQDLVFHEVNRHFNAQVLYFENGVLPGTTTIDGAGINAANSVPRDAAAFSGHPDSPPDIAQLTGRAYNKTRKQNSAMPDKYILVPFQLDRDSQILFNSQWIKSMRELVDVCCDALQQSSRDDLHLVFREHPSCRTRYDDLYKKVGELPRVIFNCDEPLAQALGRAQAVITINSTVGVEALALYKPVVLLGDAFYGIDGITRSVTNSQQLAGAIAALGSYSVDIKQLNRFFNYLTCDYVVPGDWKAPDARHYESVRRRVSRILKESQR